MIFYFWKYLKDSFPSLRIIPETRDPNDAQECVVVREGSGASDGYNLKRVDATAQIVVRAKSMHSARERANDIFELCREKHNFDFTAYETGQVDRRVKRLKAVQPPYFAGQESSGLYVYVNNYIITFQDV